MTKIIKDGTLTDANYALYESGITKGTIVPLQMFLELTDKSDTGVWLDAHEEVESIAGLLDEIPVVALNYPTFADGRSYSSASLLRRKYCFKGEIRAIGDVRNDQLEQMSRCGFNSYQLEENQDAEKAMGFLLSGFSYSYPATAKEPPLFAER